MTSQAYNNNDVLLFPLQISKQPHRRNCTEQFRVKKRDTDCLEHMHKENAKPSVKVSLMLEFSYPTQVFYSFYRGEGRSGGTQTEWERDVDVLVVAISSPNIW